MRAITDSTAMVVLTYNADEYGLPTESDGSQRQPFQWSGEERDENGLVFLRARHYHLDSRSGRFLQRDPYAGSLADSRSLNRFPYVQNNPVDLTDPSGLRPVKSSATSGACAGARLAIDCRASSITTSTSSTFSLREHH